MDDFLSEERGSTCDKCQCYTAPSEFINPAYSDEATSSPYTLSFSAGVAVGRRVQRDQDRRVLYRYQDLVRKLKRKHEEEMLLCERYRFEAKVLQQAMSEMEDQLLAMQIAYEELTVVATGPILLRNSSRDSAQHAGDPELMSTPLDTIESYQHCDDDINFPTDTSSSDSDDFETVQQLQVMEELGPIANNSDCRSLLDESRHTVEVSNSTRQEAIQVIPELQGTRTSSRSMSAELGRPSVSSLITAAHSGDAVALQTVLALIKKAERTPKQQRSDAQKFVLKTWRRKPAISPRADTQTTDSPEIFVDASSYGIGFILHDNWLAWRFRLAAHRLLPLGSDGHLVMSWAELIAVELGIRALLSANYRNTIVLIRSDNTGVVKALNEGKWTRNYGLSDILDGIFDLCKSAGLHLKAEWVWTKENPADKPSRGVYPAMELHFNYHPELPHHLAELIEEV